MAQADNEKAAATVPAQKEGAESEDNGVSAAKQLASLSSSSSGPDERGDVRVTGGGDKKSTKASKQSSLTNSKVRDPVGPSSKLPNGQSLSQIANDTVDSRSATARAAGGGQVASERPAGRHSSPPPPPQRQVTDDDKNNDTERRSTDALTGTSKESAAHHLRSPAPQQQQQAEGGYSSEDPQHRGKGTSKPPLVQKQQHKLLPIQNLLTGLELFRVVKEEEEQENAINAFTADHRDSSFSDTRSSVLSAAPLLPVPSAMAEAIKRQQKGAAVRYWKARQLQSNGGGHHPPLSLRPGGFQSGVFPILKPPAASSGNFPQGGLGWDKDVGTMVNGAAQPAKLHSKARERALRQRGKENQALAERRRSSSSNSHYYPYTNTYFVFGSSLGYPPPPGPGYKRSVSTLETLLSLPLQPTASSSSSASLYPNPPSQKLTQGSQPNAEGVPPSGSNAKLTLSYSADLTHGLKDAKLNPNTLHKLTHPSITNDPFQRLGQSVQVNGDDHSGDQLQLMPTAEGQDQYNGSSSSSSSDSSTVSELTCLQLADTILATKTADLSRFYQICQTKLRYVDLLERSTLHNEASNKSPANSPRDANAGVNGKLPKPGLPDNLKGSPAARQNSWVDLRAGGGGLPDSQDGWGGDEDGESRIAMRKGIPAALPSIVSPRDGLTLSRGFTMPSVYGMPPSSGGSFLFNDAEFNSSSSPAGASATMTSSSNGGSGVLGKPILKPFNPDANLVSLHRHGHSHDPFSPRSPLVPPLNGALSVRGTTMYPLNTDGGAGGVGRWAGGTSKDRRSRSSTSRGDADMRKRAVRFSISDQVFEFAPGEPVIP